MAEQRLHGPGSGFDSDFVPPRPEAGKEEWHRRHGAEVWKLTHQEATADWQYPDDPLIKCKIHHDYETGVRIHTVEYHAKDAKGDRTLTGKRSETNCHEKFGSAPGKKGFIIATWHPEDGRHTSIHDDKREVTSHA